MRYWAGVMLQAIGCAGVGSLAMATDDIRFTGVETPVLIDSQFPPRERKAVEQAIADWNRALNGYRKFVVESEDVAMPAETLRLHGDAYWIVTMNYNAGRSPLNDGYLAQTFHDGEVQFYARAFSDGAGYSWTAVAKHEIGHVLGLPDNQEGSTLMSRPYTGAECIDVGTLKAVAKMKGYSSLKAECQ